jgi:uncharacterized protein (DUF1778 family)
MWLVLPKGSKGPICTRKISTWAKHSLIDSTFGSLGAARALRQAAAQTDPSVTGFVLSSGVEHARELLEPRQDRAVRGHIRKFVATLEQPAEVVPELVRLSIAPAASPLIERVRTSTAAACLAEARATAKMARFRRMIERRRGLLVAASVTAQRQPLPSSELSAHQGSDRE